ncbi:MAG: primosomal protein N' [Gemmatimonadetes bacterium]|nr:primosomal protein N' [Gemmatimonadota bacterium]
MAALRLRPDPDLSPGHATPDPGTGRLLEVALPLPMARSFTYRHHGGAVEPGTRVEVPFGPRRLVGWVLGTAQGEPDARVRDVLRVLEERPSAGPDLLRLARWIADYYVSSVGLVLRAALPNPMTDAGRNPVKTRRILRLTRELPSLTLREEVFGRAARQRECFEFIEAAGGAVAVQQLGEQGFSYSVLNGLVERGVAVFDDEVVDRDPFADIPAEEGPLPPLTPDQQSTLAPLRTAAGAGGGTFLLRGVTGSGKTRVYIELLREVLHAGRGAIVLVPEIALTPQTVARFRARFGDDVAVLHSALSEGERYDAWRMLRDGERRIAVGARSAIFAPVRDLGAVIVDEEHEGSYKQGEAPRYHAREVAIVRARIAGAVCVLGSATPALESWANVQKGKYTLLELPIRVEGRPLPAVRVVDLRRPKDEGAPAGLPAAPRPADPAAKRPVLSEPLEEAIHARLGRGEQTILLLNRRGYASFVQCRDCGHVWQCGRCNVSLTYHRTRRRLICHYCFHEEAPPSRCTECGSEMLSFRGLGTEQVERIVAETFPAARIARMDVDTTSGKWAHHEILGRVERREVDILLGTQMIAKGLDFPNVTLVGVINADVGMNLPDFRAGERTFQLLTQVAGRAGRGGTAGEVLIQTAMPGSYAIRSALDHDYLGFARRELEERREPEYPPHTRLANVVISGTAEEQVQEAAEGLAAWVRAALREHTLDAVALLGPAPCAIDRIRDRWRWHLLLRSRSARQLGALCRALYRDYGTGTGSIRVIVDRDPVALL